ncbi:hypothetical protein E4U17_006127 [Claviceps sp. LM77 group G4]|nr:hypothetical protein E4U17_006127 [Claviceps sp. LM77 group G4]KAG6068636.1 hypothetical protein E4U33_005021 [Claviceps sp. LM78 group G4]KAG6071159.1 hypothetical protein E4U16_006308 [Claviceps sp. LM84 group G4]
MSLPRTHHAKNLDTDKSFQETNSSLDSFPIQYCNYQHRPATDLTRLCGPKAKEEALALIYVSALNEFPLIGGKGLVRDRFHYIAFQTSPQNVSGAVGDFNAGC